LLNPNQFTLIAAYTFQIKIVIQLIQLVQICFCVRFGLIEQTQFQIIETLLYLGTLFFVQPRDSQFLFQPLKFDFFQHLVVFLFGGNLFITELIAVHTGLYQLGLLLIYIGIYSSKGSLQAFFTLFVGFCGGTGIAFYYFFLLFLYLFQLFEVSIQIVTCQFGQDTSLSFQFCIQFLHLRLSFGNAFRVCYFRCNCLRCSKRGCLNSAEFGKRTFFASLFHYIGNFFVLLFKLLYLFLRFRDQRLVILLHDKFLRFDKCPRPICIDREYISILIHFGDSLRNSCPYLLHDFLQALLFIGSRTVLQLVIFVKQRGYVTGQISDGLYRIIELFFGRTHPARQPFYSRSYTLHPIHYTATKKPSADILAYLLDCPS